MKIGKIPPSILEELIFSKINSGTVKREEVLVRPSMGEDCSALDLYGELCCLSTDPITGASEDIGYLAVHVNANDIYSSGAEPIGIMVTVLLPYGSGPELLKNIMDGVYKAADEIGIEVLGGHSEVTDAVVRPVISATIIGKAKKFISTGKAEAGQDLIMTKWAGLEGTAIIANERSDIILAELELGREILEKALSLGRFLSIGPEARICAEFGATSMHDVTEGGILGAVYEISKASGKGVMLFKDKINILPETIAICQIFDIDPTRLVSSGSLIATAYNGEELVKLLNKDGIAAAVIGHITETDKIIISGEKYEALDEPLSDEIYKINL